MDVVVIAALVSGTITTLGLFINHFLQRSRDSEIKQRERRVDFLRQQIEEFYSPLWILSEQSNAVYDVARRRLPVGPDGRIDRSSFTDQDNQVYTFYIETYWHPINAQIVQVLRQKVYLLKDGHMPPSFIDFLRHQATSESLYRLWKEKGIDSGDLRAEYPAQFRQDVKAALDDLLRQRLKEMDLLTRAKKRLPGR